MHIFEYYFANSPIKKRNVDHGTASHMHSHRQQSQLARWDKNWKQIAVDCCPAPLTHVCLLHCPLRQSPGWDTTYAAAAAVRGGQSSWTTASRHGD